MHVIKAENQTIALLFPVPAWIGNWNREYSFGIIEYDREAYYKENVTRLMSLVLCI